MMFREEKNYYALNIKLLKIVGQSLGPSTNRRVDILIRTFMISMLTIISIAQGIKFYESDYSVENMIKILPPFCVSSGCVICLLDLYSHENLQHDLYRKISDDWKSIHTKADKEFKMKYTKAGYRITKFLTVYTFSIWVVYVPISLKNVILDIFLPINESRLLEFPIEAEFFIDPNDNYVIIMLFLIVVSFIALVIIVANMSIFAVQMLHVCGMFALIGHHLDNIYKEKRRHRRQEIENFECYNKFVRCIQNHWKCIEYVDVIAKYYDLTCFVSMFAMIILIILLLAEMSLTTYRLGVIIIGSVIYFYLPAYLGQKLSDISSEISDKVYSCHWYSYPVRIQKMLIMMITRSHKESKITVYKIWFLSLENFRDVMRLVLSYCVVLRKLR